MYIKNKRREKTMKNQAIINNNNFSVYVQHQAFCLINTLNDAAKIIIYLKQQNKQKEN